MLKTVEGIYQNGKVELTEQPQTTGERVQVLVTFLDASAIDPAKLRQLIDQLETIAESRLHAWSRHVESAFRSLPDTATPEAWT